MPPDAMCDRCPQPAVRSVAAEYLCIGHTNHILDPIRVRVLQRQGINGYGIPQTPRGDGWHDLACNTCGATWVGHSHDPCWWCQRHLELLQTHQAELVLEPPDIDPDDSRYLTAMNAWAERLARAVAADLITDTEARNAWTKATRDTRAA